MSEEGGGLIDLSNPDALRDHLLGSLSESGGAFEGWPSRMRRACGWYAELVAQGMEQAPFFFVLDLGFLLLLGRDFPFRCLKARIGVGDASPSRRRHVAYENRLLNRFLTLPVFWKLREVLEDGSDVDARIVAILECWLSPLREAPLERPQVAARAVRRLSSPGRREVEVAREEEEGRLGRPGYFAGQCEALLEAYENVSLQRLVGPEDLFVFRHIEALGRRAQRLTARRVSELEAAIGVVEPPPAHLRQEAPQVTVDLDDAGFFPQGGLDQLANRGSIENLVRTELGYIDDDEQIDLFTLRYLEGELLYYTRDEGQLMRRSRTVHLWLDLTGAHHILYPGHPARLVILLQALVGRLVDDLYGLFESDSLQVKLVVSGDRAEEVVDLWRIRFQEAIERGDLQVSHDRKGRPIDDQTPSRLMEKGRLTTLLLFGATPALSEVQRAAWLRDGLPAFVIESPPVEPRDAPWWLGIEQGVEEMIEHLQELRRTLVWRLFGC